MPEASSHPPAAGSSMTVATAGDGLPAASRWRVQTRRTALPANASVVPRPGFQVSCSSTEYSQVAIASSPSMRRVGSIAALAVPTCGAIGAVVSSVQAVITIAEVLPNASNDRAQMVFRPSPVTSKPSPSPRIQVRPLSSEYSQPSPSSSDETDHLPLKVRPSETLTPVSLKLSTGTGSTTGAGVPPAGAVPVVPVLLVAVPGLPVAVVCPVSPPLPAPGAVGPPPPPPPQAANSTMPSIASSRC